MHYPETRTKGMHFMLAIVIAFTLAMLSGCPGSMNLVKPISTQDDLQEAKSQVGAAYKTIGDLKATGQITQAQGLAAFNKVDRIETQVRLAEGAMNAGNAAAAQGQLQLALTALLAVQAELKPKP